MSAPSQIQPLSDAIRQHLGQALAVSYAGLPDLQGTERFRDLVTQLEHALVIQGDADERAFRERFLAVLPNLVGFALSLTKDRTRADDLVQDTMLKGWRHRARFEPDTNLDAWLFTIMRNQFYSDYRRPILAVHDPEGAAANRMAVAPSQGDALDLVDVQAAIDRLPVTMREALVLVAVNEVSYEEAAMIMGCEIGTVKSRVHRAREKLTRLLGYEANDLKSDDVMMSATVPSSLPFY